MNFALMWDEGASMTGSAVLGAQMLNPDGTATAIALSSEPSPDHVSAALTTACNAVGADTDGLSHLKLVKNSNEPVHPGVLEASASLPQQPGHEAHQIDMQTTPGVGPPDRGQGGPPMA